jgi:hypothetical protein
MSLRRFILTLIRIPVSVTPIGQGGQASVPLIVLLLLAVHPAPFAQSTLPARSPADSIRGETLRSWNAYVRYAWGYDDFRPLSKKGTNWYAERLGISMIDAYSTLKLMGRDSEAGRVERFVADSIRFDGDIAVKTFEVDIRILGGLLCMYHLSGNPAVLAKAEDFGRRLLPAFRTCTGIPRYYVNLKTGESHGDTVNVAEGGSSLLEMGILSMFTGNPEYYQTAKRASRALYDRRFPTGLVAQDIDVQRGVWLDRDSHIGACIDSYYEYLLKGWVLFGDPDLKRMWDTSIAAIQRYIPDTSTGRLWYGHVDARTGESRSSVVTLWDAYFPAVLTLAGDLPRAVRLETSWERLWDAHGLEPMVYDFRKDSIIAPAYSLNPEIIESAYYLFQATGDRHYRDMSWKMFADLLRYCRTAEAFSCIADVRTKTRADEMPSFFFAETLKYFYLTFADVPGFAFRDIVFTTEGHPFRRSAFPRGESRKRLGW